MAELASLDALGGVVGDTHQNQELLVVYSDGEYLWSQAKVATTDIDDTRPIWLTEPTDSGAAAAASLTWLDPAGGYPAASANDVIQVHAEVTIGGDTWPAGTILRAEIDTPGGVSADWSVFVSAAGVETVTGAGVDLTDARNPIVQTSASGVEGTIDLDVVEKQRLFIDDADVSPAVAGEPTEAEVNAWAALDTSRKDRTAYYTGTSTNTDPITHVFELDGVGQATLSRAPSAGGNIYDTDDTLTGDRTVTMDGNDLTLSGAQDTILRDVGVHDAVAWRKTTGGGLFGSGTVQPDLATASDFTWGIANSDVGDLTVQAPATSINGFAKEFRLSFANTDTVPRNIVFDAHYMDRDGTPLGTQVVAANSILGFDFTYVSGLFVGSYLDHVLPAASDVASTVIDSSAAPVAEALPAATGSGAILFYSNEDVTNTASLAPASGEQLNSVVDATFLFSNYAAGTQFQATDVGPGQWVVSVVGEGVTLDDRSTVLTTADIVHSGNGVYVSGTGNPGTGQVMLLDGKATLTRLADKGIITVELEIDEDDEFTLDFASVIPAGGSILSYTNNVLGAGATHYSVVRGPSETSLSFNRNDSIDADIKLSLSLVADGWPVYEEHVLAGMVLPEALHYTYVALSADATSVAAPNGTFPIPFDVTRRSSSGSPLALNADGSVALEANKRYRITSLPATADAENLAVWDMTNDVQLSDQYSNLLGNTNGNLVTTFDTTSAIDVAVVSFNAANVRGGAFTLNGSSTDGVAWMLVEELPASTVVMPDALTPTQLDYVSIGGNTSSATVTAADPAIDLDAPTFAQVHDPSGLINTTTNAIDIAQDGLYELVFAGHESGGGRGFFIYVNGARVAQVDNVVTGDDETYKTVRVIVPLSAGDAVTFGITGTAAIIHGIQISVKQLPDYSVVAYDPGEVEAKPLGSMRAYMSTSIGSTSGANTNIISPSNWTVDTDTLGFANNGTSEITLTEGRYKASMWLADNAPTDRWTGQWQLDGSNVGLLGSCGDADDNILSKSPAVAEIVVGAGQTKVLTFNTVDASSTALAFSSNDPGTWWEIEQLPTLEVVQPGSISVNDQTASGYLDLGDMRIQQGRGVTSGGNQTIAYPAPFADTTYALTVTPATAAAGFTSYSADTATGATIHTWNDAGNPIDLSYSWIAIGAKP